MAHGGKRRGAGRKHGTQTAATKAKHVVEELFRAYMLKEHEALWQAQRERAAGAYVLVAKAKDGVLRRITNPAEIDKVLAKPGRGKTHWLIETQAPDAQLAKEINNRLMGLPAQPVEVGTTDGRALPVRIVLEELKE